MAKNNNPVSAEVLAKMNEGVRLHYALATAGLPKKGVKK